MTYDDWLYEHFGGAYLPPIGADILARKAWEAATKSEREACAKSDGEIYAEVSRRAAPEAHAALDKLIQEALKTPNV